MILEDICDVYSGYAIKQFNEDKIGVPVIKIGNILMDGTIELEDCQYTTEKVNQKYYSEYQDIYIALSGATTGKIGILKRQDKFIVNQRVGIVRKKDNNIPIEFIKYFLFHHTDRIFKEAAGCAQPNISPKQIGKYKVPIIDDSRMKYVVEILDSLTRIINKRKRQLNYLDELIKARFVEMFGDPIKNQKGWDIVTIGDIVTDVRYGTSKPAVDGGKYSYLRMNNLTADGHLDLNDMKYIDISEDEIEKYIVRKGDVLFNRTNSIDLVGKTVVFDLSENMVIAGYIIRVRFNERLLPEVFAQYMNLEALKDILRSMAKGAVNQANINAQELQSIKVYVPDIKLQEHFVDIKEQVNKSKVEVKKALDEAQLLFDSLMQKYFG